MYQGTELAHYTNLVGLQGILESQGFWLSDHRFLNDAEEYNNGKKLVIGLLKNLILKKRYMRFKSILERTLLLLENDKDESPYFICSFSTRIDSLDQWKGYANNSDGVAIVFDNTMESMFNHFNMLPILKTSKVIYRDCKKYQILLKTIRRYFKEFLRDEIEFPQYIDLDDWVQHLYKDLSLEFINFKNLEFESESEVRLIISDLKYGVEQKPCFKLQHRVANDRIIPYINTADEYRKHLKGKKLPIKKVIVAPTHKDITYESVKSFLKNIGYGDVIVEKSKVPYRG